MLPAVLLQDSNQKPNICQYFLVTTSTHFTNNFIRWQLVSTLNWGHHQGIIH
jgi:hypothetical protein